jgi:hypothetical protein
VAAPEDGAIGPAGVVGPSCPETPLVNASDHGRTAGQTARVPPDTPLGQPAFRTLDRPRPPSPAEQRLLSWLAAGVGPELTAQADSAVVVGECACGCSSVQLATTAAPLPAATISQLSGAGRSDYVAVSSTGHSPEGHVISVVLHVAEGRLHELEVFDSDAGEGVAVDPASLVRLGRPDVG